MTERAAVIFKLQVVVIADDGNQEICEITSVARKDLKPATLGLPLAEGKAILKDIQEIVIQRQSALCLATYRQCLDYGALRTGYHDLSVQTVFGRLKMQRARLHHCGCRPHESKTFSPLADLLPEHTTPELLFLETKWASLMSYGMTTRFIENFLPMDAPLNAFTIRITWSAAERAGAIFVRQCAWSRETSPASARLTVLKQIAKGRPEKFGDAGNQCELRRAASKTGIHQVVLVARQRVQGPDELRGLEMDLDAATLENKNETVKKLLKRGEELRIYVERNRQFVSNYGERSEMGKG